MKIRGYNEETVNWWVEEIYGVGHYVFTNTEWALHILSTKDLEIWITIGIDEFLQTVRDKKIDDVLKLNI